MRFYLKILSASDLITVLGEKQLQFLMELGVPSKKLVILPNCGDETPLASEKVREKHFKLQRDPDASIVLLHLSLLIESKGFVKFLEACALFSSSHRDRNIKVVLCGPITNTFHDESFSNSAEKVNWIENKISKLNSMPNVTAKWIPGAIGSQKTSLFHEAHCFVMPTRYPVEVQPLVLLEAMAAGCCIIASDQGEIPSTMGDSVGLCLRDTSEKALSKAISKIAIDHNFRSKSALAAIELSSSIYSRTSYGSNWHKILTNLSETVDF